MERGQRGVRVTAVLSAAVATGLSVRALAFDRTFNVSLVGSLSPLGNVNNVYSDLSVEGNLVAIGSATANNSTPGLGKGVSLIDNTNPAAPLSLAYYNPSGTTGSAANSGQFRDILIHGTIGYFALDDSSTIGGIDVVDLSNPSNPVKIRNVGTLQNNQLRCHDLFIDGNYLYVASNQNTTMKVFDISTPSNPTFVRNVITYGASSDHLHDMTVKNGRMYTSNLSNGVVQIYDVSNIGTQAPALLAQFKTDTVSTGRTHSSWPNEDGTILAVAHEEANENVKLYDISNLSAFPTTGTPLTPTPLATIDKTSLGIDSHSPHDPVIVGDTLYVSWYQAGLQILNIRDPAHPQHMGAYDTFVGGDGSANSFIGYDGNWGVYPFFGPQKILLSDFDKALITVDATAAFKRPWTYGNDDNGKWQDNSKWGNNVGVFPNSSEMSASFTNAFGGTVRTVTVDGSLMPFNPRVAAIEFNSNYSYTIAASNGGELQFKSSAANATITVLAGANSNGVNRITCPIDLQDDLNVINNAANTTSPTLELGAIRGTEQELTFNGTGMTALTAASPSFSGIILVDGGTLSLRHGGATNGRGIILTGGTLALQNDASTNFSSDVSVTNNATLRVGNIATGTGQTHSIRDLTVNSGKTLSFSRQNGAHLAARNVTINGTFAIAAGAGAGSARFDSLNIPAGGKLNLGDGAVVITNGGSGSWNGSIYTAATGLIASGRNGGSWNGSGIMTSAPTGSTFAIGVASASQANRAGGAFGGISVAASDTLLMYTYAGDANLDGKINVDDYGRIDFNVTVAGAAGWYNGDFNYDGKIDVDDYGIIDLAVGIQGLPLATGSGASYLGSVPEPGSSVLTAAATVILATYRRNSHRRTPFLALKFAPGR
jgi:hypothetical protein